jgi:hypothetical protein
MLTLVHGVLLECDSCALIDYVRVIAVSAFIM